MGKLDDRVVVVTGTGKGLGKQNAIRFAAEGACVSISDWSEERLEETRLLCLEHGENHRPSQARFLAPCGESDAMERR
ncbi:MAG: SDR family NAD(P)-dependent oxidoreductase [Thermomicrobiales bacterium]